MKLPDSLVGLAAALAASLVAGACSTSAQTSIDTSSNVATDYGPAADYPVILGDPYTVDDVLYTPSDTMNYDRVGYVLAEDGSAVGITGAHTTLPLPSYVEVAALDSGRTILVRIERRGPMRNDRLLALSPAALNQLGIVDGAPVRMRRVNPPEDQRAKLRAGTEAQPRMDTPEGLLVVLRKRLPSAGSVSLTDPRQAQVSGTTPTQTSIEAIDPTPEAAQSEPVAQPAPIETVSVAHDEQSGVEAVEAPTATAMQGKYVVQLGAFSVRKNAEALAAKVGGFLIESGRLTIVRTGPFTTSGQATDALAKLRSQGYSDAQIRTLD